MSSVSMRSSKARIYFWISTRLGLDCSALTLLLHACRCRCMKMITCIARHRPRLRHRLDLVFFLGAISTSYLEKGECTLLDSTLFNSL